MPFGVALGQRLRQVREELGETGADLAKRCHWVGLGWDRPTVTRVEQGKRQVTAAELLLLPMIYDRSLADLLPPETVALTSGERATTATAEALREALTSPPHAMSGGWQVGPGVLADFEAAREHILASFRRLKAPMPSAEDWHIVRASRHVNDQVTTKAARALGATAWEVATAAQELWGRGLEAERDARAEELGPAANTRARQARRGHITRRLLEELRPAIEQLRTPRNEDDV
ncbi:MAG: helix-turn-helix domain-containing protein [Actinomycetota bacterium]|nr:helix-turn-helix domain-containing protein [Actinomycetota bacterium]